MYRAVERYDLNCSAKDGFDKTSNPNRAQSVCVLYTETSARNLIPRCRATVAIFST
jgi:hypothetical protein